MKILSAVKRNAYRAMCMTAIAATLAVGVAMPAAYAAGAPRTENVQNQIASVTDTYKSFSGNSFFVAKYDLTYRDISYHRTLIELGPKAIKYSFGYYNGYPGYITLWKCQYEIR